MFTVRYDWREYQFNIYEKPCYLFAIILPLSIGISGLILEAYNPSRLAHICYFNDYPQDCSDNPDVGCIRGEKGDVVGWVGIACLMVAALVGFFGTISVYITVRSKTRKANRRSLELQWPRLSDNVRRDRLSKEQAVAMQAVLYSLVYLNSFIWPFLVFAINESVDTQGREGEPGLFTLQLLAWILFPLRGGFNCIVYLNPQWRRWRAIHPSAGKMTTAWNVVKGESPMEARKNRVREEGNHIVEEAEGTTAATTMQSSTRQSSRMLFDGSWFFTSFKRLSKRISRRSSDGASESVMDTKNDTEDLPKFTSYVPKSARSKSTQNDEKDVSIGNNNIIVPAAAVEEEEDTRRRSLLDDEALW